MTTSQLTEIEKNFPRIVAAITLLWGNPEMDAYFNRIAVDDRGDREGFPPDVMSDILFLASLHADAYSFDSTEARYANGGKRLNTGMGFR
jgi:hypothetical protein